MSADLKLKIARTAEELGIGKITDLVFLHVDFVRLDELELGACHLHDALTSKRESISPLELGVCSRSDSRANLRNETARWRAVSRGLMPEAMNHSLLL